MKSFVSHESYYQCDCGSEILLVRQYNYEKEPEPQIEVSIFKQNLTIMSLRNRLRWIWNLLLNKEIFADQIMLNKEEMERLGNTLIQLSKEIK
jgi:hypothetical protein